MSLCTNGIEKSFRQSVVKQPSERTAQVVTYSLLPLPLSLSLSLSLSYQNISICYSQLEIIRIK